MQSIVLRNADVISEQIGGEVVLVVPHLAFTLVLNRTGAHVWAFLDGEHTLAEVAEALADRFAVSPAVAREDVLALVGQLAERNLVHLGPKL